MKQLSANVLPKNTRLFSYDRGTVKCGIVHFGVGNFHRAHQATYCEDLLEAGDTHWGITGVSLRSAGMRDDLRPQDFLYTLAILGDTTEYRCIGALQNILVAPKDPDSVVKTIASPVTQIVSSTITEKGYHLGAQGLNFDAPNMAQELKSLEHPTTIFGFIACGLIARYQDSSTAKLTIMCCDNISGGGEILQRGVMRLLSEHHPDTLAWAKSHVTFISSMVDRVSPATGEVLRETVLKETGCRDARPVSAEPFTQWIIEDNFAGMRPEFDKVGAIFVDDIAPFERMKLRYLNAAHTIASTLGFLAGTIYVHEALEQPDILNFTRRALYEAVLPHAAVPDGADGKAYIENVISRFQNSNLPYANLQVGTDSSQKIQQRWYPTIDLALRAEGETRFFQFALAAWTGFINTALEQNVLNDPKKDEFKAVSEKSLEARITSYLNIAGAESFAFSKDPKFLGGIQTYANEITAHGSSKALSQFLAAV